MVIALVFDGHVRNVDNLGLDVFVTFSVATVTEFPADILLILLLDRWGRRILACSTLVISGIFSIWASCVYNSKCIKYCTNLKNLKSFCVKRDAFDCAFPQKDFKFFKFEFNLHYCGMSV